MSAMPMARHAKSELMLASSSPGPMNSALRPRTFSTWSARLHAWSWPEAYPWPKVTSSSVFPVMWGTPPSVRVIVAE